MYAQEEHVFVQISENSCSELATYERAELSTTAETEERNVLLMICPVPEVASHMAVPTLT